MTVDVQSDVPRNIPLDQEKEATGGEDGSCDKDGADENDNDDCGDDNGEW